MSSKLSKLSNLLDSGFVDGAEGVWEGSRGRGGEREISHDSVTPYGSDNMQFIAECNKNC